MFIFISEPLRRASAISNRSTIIQRLLKSNLEANICRPLTADGLPNAAPLLKTFELHCASQTRAHTELSSQGQQQRRACRISVITIWRRAKGAANVFCLCAEVAAERFDKGADAAYRRIRISPRPPIGVSPQAPINTHPHSVYSSRHTLLPARISTVFDDTSLSHRARGHSLQEYIAALTSSAAPTYSRYIIRAVYAGPLVAAWNSIRARLPHLRVSLPTTFFDISDDTHCDCRSHLDHGALARCPAGSLCSRRRHRQARPGHDGALSPGLEHEAHERTHFSIGTFTIIVASAARLWHTTTATRRELTSILLVASQHPPSSSTSTRPSPHTLPDDATFSV